MHKNVSLTAVLLLMLLLCGYAFALSSTNFQINWLLPLTGTGGNSLASANYVTDVTLGQTVIGSAASNNYQAGFGYWKGIQPDYEIYLPIILSQ